MNADSASGWHHLREKWRVQGTIKAVLNLNLGKSCFDPTRSRYRYWDIRGSGELAGWLRSLSERLTSPGTPFELDTDAVQLTERAYRAGMISQYILDQEILPTYRIRPGFEPQFAFDQKTATRIEALDSGLALRRELEQHGHRRLLGIWNQWETKRVRLSRYGMIQVVLEHRFEEPLDPADFVSPFAGLEAAFGVKSLAQSLAQSQEVPPPQQQELRKLAALTLDPLEISAPWELVGRILIWMLDEIRHTAPSDGSDLLCVSRKYLSNWREREARVPGGLSLPLRGRFLIMEINRLETLEGISAGAVSELNVEALRALAQLAEGVPLVQEGGQLKISPQSSKVLRQIVRENHATWNREACFLSAQAAIFVNLHSDLKMKDCDLDYEEYWRILARTCEYQAELRIIASLLQYKTSDQLESAMREAGADPDSGKSNTRLLPLEIARAASSIVARLKNSSTPSTISQTNGILVKLAALRKAFGISESIDHTDRNLTALLRLITHSENVNTVEKVAKLNTGLAGFTAALMGLTLPTFAKEVFGPESLDHLSIKVLAAFWVGLSAWMIGWALKDALSGSRKRYKAWKRRRAADSNARRASVQEAPTESFVRNLPSVEISIHESDGPADRPRLRMSLSRNGALAKLSTDVEVFATPASLHIEFHCSDPVPEATYTERDAALWDEEVVGVLLAPGTAHPHRYVEIAVNPIGTLFDAVVSNATGSRLDLAVDTGWTCAGIDRTLATEESGWRASLKIPWKSVLEGLNLSTHSVPSQWRVNFYRIERPRGEASECSTWSQTGVELPDFHRPPHFGFLRLKRL